MGLSWRQDGLKLHCRQLLLCFGHKMGYGRDSQQWLWQFTCFRRLSNLSSFSGVTADGAGDRNTRNSPNSQSSSPAVRRGCLWGLKRGCQLRNGSLLQVLLVQTCIPKTVTCTETVHGRGLHGGFAR